MPEIRANGVSLYYEDHGAGEPIVCIHGTSTSAAVWGAAAVDALAGRGRTIVYDRRGCFRSERPEPYVTSVREHADDAAALIEALGAEPSIVIGRSYGGETALDLALRYPERVRALVLLEAALLSLDEEAASWASRIEERLLVAAESDMGSVAETFIREVAGDKAWEGFPAAVKRMLTDNGPAIVAELRGGFLDVTVEQLGAIRLPTLLVAGKASPPAFARVTRLMAEAIPSARLEWVEGGHLLDPSSPAILAFVDEQLRRA